MTEDVIKRLQLERLKIKENLERIETAIKDFQTNATLIIEDRALDPEFKSELSNQTKRTIAAQQLLNDDLGYITALARELELRHDMTVMDIHIEYQQRVFRREIAEMLQGVTL